MNNALQAIATIWLSIDQWARGDGVGICFCLVLAIVTLQDLRNERLENDSH